MNILSIGNDQSLFKDGSPDQRRILEYGRALGHLDIILYTPPGFEERALSPEVRLYPTNVKSIVAGPKKAYEIGRELARTHAYDWITAQDPAEAGLVGRWLKKKTGIKLQIQMHADFLSPHFRKNSFKDALRQRISRRVIPKADLIRAVSERIKRSLVAELKIPESRISVLPIFVDREAIAARAPRFNLHEKYPEFDRIILMVSRLTLEKNIPMALEAFANVLKSFPRAGLVIVGEGPERKNLEAGSSNREIKKNVRFEGWQEDLVSYYKTADLYLLASNYEGYGRTVVEAAAAGLPVAMTDVGLAGELIRDCKTGRVVAIGNAEALSRALKELLENPEAARGCAMRAQKEALSSGPKTWEEYLKNYRGLFAA